MDEEEVKGTLAGRGASSISEQGARRIRRWKLSELCGSRVWRIFFNAEDKERAALWSKPEVPFIFFITSKYSYLKAHEADNGLS
jgi:hypothetical protein